jgi:hypothetical protein
MIIRKILFFMLIASISAFSQTKEAYDQAGQKGGLGDTSRLSIHHSLSFGMGAASGMNMQSQGLYSTLLTYKFSQPVTLHLNFGFPLYSTFSPNGNLSQQNLTSMEYFKNMPLEASLSWQPTSNLFLQLNIVRNPQYDYLSGMVSPYYSNNPHLFQRW